MEYYKRKPATVQAEQWVPSEGYPPFTEFVEGKTIDPGDWIITHQDGTRTVCKQEDFEKEYEPL